MKKIPLIHGKFRAKNNPMKFHFAVFMGFSHEIHGIFIKLQFIVYSTHLRFRVALTVILVIYFVEKNIHHSKPYKVQTMEITKLFTISVCFGRHM